MKYTDLIPGRAYRLHVEFPFYFIHGTYHKDTDGLVDLYTELRIVQKTDGTYKQSSGKSVIWHDSEFEEVDIEQIKAELL